jgi:hypothetical protein
LLAFVDLWRNSSMPPRDNLSGLLLFAFRYRSPLTGKWVKARYVAERQEIAARYSEWETIGRPEIRRVVDWDSGFNPMKGSSPQSPK